MAPAEVGDLAERHLQPTDLLELLEDVMAAREQALQARAQWLDKGPGLEGPGLEVLALGSHDGEPSITLVGDPQSIRSCAALLYRRVRLVPAAQVAEALVRANVEGK
jgi:hypothetical protein